MKRTSSENTGDSIVIDLQAQSAAKDQELNALRRQVADQEEAYRQAQERINDYSRDWLYTTVCNFRDRIAWLKYVKDKIVSRTCTLFIVGRLLIGLLLLPVLVLARFIGLRPRQAVEREQEFCRLHVGFNSELPNPMVIGKGSCFVVDGWVFHPQRRITMLEIRVILAQPKLQLGEIVDRDDMPDENDLEFVDRPVPVILRNIPNRKVLGAHFPKIDRNGNSYWSGFYAALTIPPIKRAGRAQLVVKAYLDDGSIETAVLGKFHVQPEPIRSDLNIPIVRHGTGPLVAIGMCTYNPPVELLHRQIASIRNQTHTNWFCIIRDDGSGPDAFAALQEVISGDDRFHLSRNPKNLGFYHNFAAVMSDVPPEADFVALSDQDDIWQPDKLESLIREFTPETMLVYSDMRIVTSTGQVKSASYWTSRDSNHDNFTNLIFANTVTGAASMFRRSLLNYLLPFPDEVGDSYHDHWLAITAMALGKIGYVNRPLYDYVQHSNNVVGHVAPKPQRWVGALYRFAAFFYPPRISRNIATFFRHGYGYYTHDFLRVQHNIRNAIVRFGPEMKPARIDAMIRVLRALETWRGMVWLCLRPIRPNAWRETIGVEAHLLQAICWRAWHRIRGWFGPRITVRGGLRHSLAKYRIETPKVYDHIDSVAAIERATAPLTLSIHDDSPRRVNLIVSIIDFKYVFGGYITVFHLARCLSERGFQVRLIVVDECDFRPVFWAKNFQKYPGLEDFLDRVELIYAFDRRTVVHVGPNDVFLPTSWWTAHIAHKATKAIGKDRFVYLVQEYEPGFYQYGALASIASQSYTFPHFALFSTELLREYFRLHGHGVFATREGELNSASFQNTITTAGSVTVDELTKKKRPKRLLFYCRPEPHALRNMFDIGIIALRRAIAEGHFAGWEFHGVGSVHMLGRIKLGPDTFMDLLPRHDQESYRKILKDYDVGLSLMCSPHPSLVPLEMCSAGMLTVTNTYANKTAEKLLALSENFVPVDGTVEGVCEGLKTALGNVGHVVRRVRGAKVNWATRWEQSFHPALLSRLDQFIHAAMGDVAPEREIIRKAA